MPCASCGRSRLSNSNPLTTFPYNASDIQVYRGDEVRKFEPTDWPLTTHKLLLFVSDLDLRLCEFGDLNDWASKFTELGCDLFLVTSEPIHVLKDAIDNQLGTGPLYTALSSYLLPTRMNILHNGKCKDASVIITKDGEVAITQYLFGVGRSMDEIYRNLYRFVHGQECPDT